MGLREYRRKRDFARTPEPAGAKETAGSAYVIQKHAASRLHYDLRLQIGGTLKSWAVPKGPSLDPSERRLAVHVEDHPLEYASFEGIIPQNEYGGGTVIVWDRGTWEPRGDPERMYRQGRLSFTLRGSKLRGGFHLVRMSGEAGEQGKNWLLIKDRDDEASPGKEIVKERPESAASGRTLEQVRALGGSPVWRSSRPAAVRREGRASKRSPSSARPPDPARIEGARRAALPAALRHELPTLVDAAPAGDEWLHEIKHDGYRVFLILQRGRATLRTRGGKDWTDRFSALARAGLGLPVRSAVLDGEVVTLQPDGTSSFQALQNSLASGGAGLTLMAFDLPYLDGYDLAGATLEARKEALRRLCAAGDRDGALRYSDHVAGSGPEVSRQACAMALEGIVSKRRGSLYRPGRTREWLKVKCHMRQEFVIGGWTAPGGTRTGFGSLLVGDHDRSGRLVYAGKVGTGFTEGSLRSLAARLSELGIEASPFAEPPPRAIERRAKWVRPELVCEVEFSAWTDDGRLRHPAFLGLREDKRPAQVGREKALPVGRAAVRVPQGGPREQAGSPVGGRVEVAGVRLTHPRRVLYPEQGITKHRLALYYQEVARRMLPQVAGRPLTLVRCPEGRGGECFYQKHAREHLPGAVRRIPIREKASTGLYLTVDSAAGIVSLVQMGVLEIHLWGARSDDVERPDLMVLDLDPDPAVEWPRVVEAAFRVRRRLASLGLRSFVKTTGGKGLHVVAPIVPGPSWDELKSFSRAIALSFASEAPDRFTAVMSKAKRKGKIYVDYLRNGRGASFIAPYSTRARPGAPVSAPLTWKELTPAVRNDSFTLREMADRVRRDPWKGFEAARAPVTAEARRALERWS
ncbi:MAG TPA: DNA ligase D [Candidatus Polarisedimenticolia bacterium]|nr:DNA ligase D [Candidatus Polarisedimenticolia bacterium]